MNKEDESSTAEYFLAFSAPGRLAFRGRDIWKRQMKERAAELMVHAESAAPDWGSGPEVERP
jgi:hypothetical protein